MNTKMLEKDGKLQCEVQLGGGSVGISSKHVSFIGIAAARRFVAQRHGALTLATEPTVVVHLQIEEHELKYVGEFLIKTGARVTEKDSRVSTYKFPSKLDDMNIVAYEKYFRIRDSVFFSILDPDTIPPSEHGPTGRQYEDIYAALYSVIFDRERKFRRSRERKGLECVMSAGFLLKTAESGEEENNVYISNCVMSQKEGPCVITRRVCTTTEFGHYLSGLLSRMFSSIKEQRPPSMSDKEWLALASDFMAFSKDVVYVFVSLASLHGAFFYDAFVKNGVLFDTEEGIIDFLSHPFQDTGIKTVGADSVEKLQEMFEPILKKLGGKTYSHGRSSTIEDLF